MFLAKDFVETQEGLVFAVVESGMEQGKVLCFLRYILLNKQWQKVNTEQANQFLTEHYPQYLYYSPFKQASCHAVTLDRVFKHHQPRERLNQLLSNKVKDNVESDLVALCRLYEAQGLDLGEVGVTGSILISAQNHSSDIDLVFYSRAVFNRVRKMTQKLVLQGDCSDLNDNDWQDSYDRRCCDLSYSEYLWHEKRKFNKAVINQRKFDLNFVLENTESASPSQYEKLGAIVLKIRVADDKLAFDYPAEFLLEHEQIKLIVSYTATYTGQAQAGEWVEVAGQLEQSIDGAKRIVVGSSREAKGEYIKVIDG
ncbi:MAG: hypothetical protein KAQ91_08210 [Methylococcales bacterium]|nr:hypothetical protein [Methylococcales bacterium]